MSQRSWTWESRREVWLLGGNAGGLLAPSPGQRGGKAGWPRPRRWAERAHRLLLGQPSGFGAWGTPRGAPRFIHPLLGAGYTLPGRVAREHRAAKPPWGFAAGWDLAPASPRGFAPCREAEARRSSQPHAPRCEQTGARSQVWFWQQPSGELRPDHVPRTGEPC